MPVLGLRKKKAAEPFSKTGGLSTNTVTKLGIFHSTRKHQPHTICIFVISGGAMLHHSLLLSPFQAQLRYHLITKPLLATLVHSGLLFSELGWLETICHRYDEAALASNTSLIVPRNIIQHALQSLCPNFYIRKN